MSDLISTRVEEGNKISSPPTDNVPWFCPLCRALGVVVVPKDHGAYAMVNALRDAHGKAQHIAGIICNGDVRLILPENFAESELLLYSAHPV